MWERWLKWPETRPWVADDELDADELAWVEMQQQIDRGVQHCRRCDRFGLHTYCGGCGARHQGSDHRWRECPKCKSQVATDFCPFDGTHVAIDFLKRMESGEVDWLAEAKMAGDIYRRILRNSPRLRQIIAPGYEAPTDAVGVATSIQEALNG